jgi:hypothetical protein
MRSDPNDRPFGELAVRILLQHVTGSAPTALWTLRRGGSNLRAGHRHHFGHLRQLLRATHGHLRGLRAEPTVHTGGGRNAYLSDVRSAGDSDLRALREEPTSRGAVGRGPGVRHLLHGLTAPSRCLCGV